MPDCPECGSDMDKTDVAEAKQRYYICQECDSPFPKGSVVRDCSRQATVVGYGYGEEYGPDCVHWVVVEWHDGGPGQGVNPASLELVESPSATEGVDSSSGDGGTLCQCQSPELIENFALGKKFSVCRKCKKEVK